MNYTIHSFVMALNAAKHDAVETMKRSEVPELYAGRIANMAVIDGLGSVAAAHRAELEGKEPEMVNGIYVNDRKVRIEKCRLQGPAIDAYDEIVDACVRTSEKFQMFDAGSLGAVRDLFWKYNGGKYV